MRKRLFRDNGEGQFQLEGRAGDPGLGLLKRWRELQLTDSCPPSEFAQVPINAVAVQVESAQIPLSGYATARALSPE